MVTCEMVGALAHKAREIIAHNGYADRITVHHKRSTELAVDTELPARAQVLVSEIFSSNLLGEGVLTSLEDAHARLLAPGAVIVPRAAETIIELAGGAAVEHGIRVGTCAGFDLSPLNEFTPERLPLDGGHLDYDRYSAPFVALRFDFREARYPPREHLVETTVTRSGLCLGVVQWLRIELDDVGFYENRPDPATSRLSPWMPSLYTFEEPVRVEQGQTFRLYAGHGRGALFFRVAGTP